MPKVFYIFFTFGFDNHPRGDNFCQIPQSWYAECPICAISGMRISPYLCTMINSCGEIRLRLSIEQALCVRLALTLHS